MSAAAHATAVVQHFRLSLRNMLAVLSVNCSVSSTQVMIYKYNRATTIADSEFVWVGESGIVSVGTTNRIDGTGGDQPRGNQILRNLVHEVGIFGKQTAGYVQAMTAQTTLKSNVMFK